MIKNNFVYTTPESPPTDVEMQDFLNSWVSSPFLFSNFFWVHFSGICNYCSKKVLTQSCIVMILFRLNGTETDKLNNKQYLLFCNKAIQVQGWTAFSCLAHIKCNWLYLHQLFKIHCIVVAGKRTIFAQFRQNY